ncbi:zinc finger (C2H2 type) family protein [Arabidopsis thaliana]|uniref:Zinc finger (C2H2 type) family protein n=2 Tax=Arabidopsis thaliana TaxID=3702 RepID=F4J311_ARATH|nr:zinc finger (C2H2 type) family protein [Arabidopsis thaliana]AEE77570.1 zinc finger (C2H2 type) family protein [Arabidopsis thaliana]|eukprot:NP_189580.1 zinc finger (C2H2 type) family protein [Arabidopsis thaliana]
MDLDGVELLLDLREMVSQSGFEKSTTCSGVIALRSNLQSKSSHKCKICGKSFECYQALGGHQRIHRPIKEKLSKQEFSEVYPRKSKLQKRPESSSSCYECKVCGKIFGCYRGLGGHTKLHRSTKRELASTQDENSLLDSSEAKKIVSQPSSFKVSQEEKFLHCVELKQDFSEPLSHSGALPSTLRSKLQTKTQWKSSCHCKICGKSFVCSQGLGNHKRVHREISGKLACKRKYTEDYNPFSDSLKAKKIVKKPSSFEVSQEEKILHCVELKQDFGELLAHSGFDKSISCSKSIKVKKVARKNEKTEDSTSLFGVFVGEMSQRLHGCKTCGRKFGTLKGVYGHQRMHSGNHNRIEDENGLERIWGLKKKSRVCSVSAFDRFKGSSFMAEIEKHEVIEAALNLVMLCQGVYDFASISNLPLGDGFMDLELKPCPLRRKLQKKSRSSYKCSICEKSFVCSQALGSHQRLHRWKLVPKPEYIEDDSSLLDSSEAKKIVSKPSSFEHAQEEKILQCVEPKLEFHEQLAHSGFDKFDTCSKIRFSALPSPPEAKKIVSQPPSFEVSVDEKILYRAEPKLNFSEPLAHSCFDNSSSYRSIICGKSFVCSQALGGHQTLHRSIKGQLAGTEDGNSLSVTDSEASKIVAQPSSYKSQGI